MSTVIAKNLQLGADLTPANNYTLYQPATPDGTVRLGYGNAGSVTDVLSISSGGLTLSGGTANGVTYLNGSKVLTSGSALTFDGTNLGVGASSPSVYGKLVSLGGDNATLFAAVGATNMLRVQGYNSTYAGTVIESVNLAQSANTPIFLNSSVTKFGISGSEGMRLTSTGLGIGTSSPSGKLDVAGSVGTVRVETTGNKISFTRNGANYISAAGGSSASISYDAPVHYFNNGDGTTEYARIDSSGNLLVGTTSLSGNGFTMYPIGSGGGVYTVYNRPATSNTTRALDFQDGGTTKGSISYTNTATLFNTTSDYRLKEDIQPMSDATSRVLALNPVNFAWKNDGSRVDGFIAHEAQAVVPEAVTGEKDAVDDEGKPQYQGIDQSKLVPVLTKALQEAIGEINDLKARLTAAGL